MCKPRNLPAGNGFQQAGVHLALPLIAALRNQNTISRSSPVPLCTALLHLRNRVRGTSSETTHVLASFNKEIPLHAPQVAPGVLDDPVRSPVLLSIAHGQDSMVHLVRGVLTAWVGIHSFPVVHEVTCHLKGKAHWVVLPHSFHHAVLVILRDIDDILDKGNGFLWLELAGAILGPVWVTVLPHQPFVVQDVLEGLAWQAPARHTARTQLS